MQTSSNQVGSMLVNRLKQRSAVFQTETQTPIQPITAALPQKTASITSKIPTIRARSGEPDAAKIPLLAKSKIPVFGYQTDNSLADEINQQK